MNDENIGLLGLVLLNTIRFAEGDFGEELNFIDPIQQRRTKGNELFKKVDKGWLVETNSLPGIVSVKAIGVDRNMLFMETSLFDEEKLCALAEEKRLPIVVFDEGKRFIHSRTRNKLATVVIPTKWKAVAGAEGRCLWHIEFVNLSTEEKRDIVSFLDLVSQEDIFLETEEEATAKTSSALATPRLTLNMNLGFSQLLAQEQVPLLMFWQEGRMETTVRTEQIQALFALQRSILKMEGNELVEFLEQNLSEEGRRKTLSVFHFVLSGKVKKAKPDLSWKEARKLAWRLINKSPPAVAT